MKDKEEYYMKCGECGVGIPWPETTQHHPVCSDKCEKIWLERIDEAWNKTMKNISYEAKLLNFIDALDRETRSKGNGHTVLHLVPKKENKLSKRRIEPGKG